MGKGLNRWVAAAALMSAGLPAAALSLGLTDTFESGAGGWSAGAANPHPPTVVLSGGPHGAGDGYLLVQSFGGVGAGSRLTAIAGPQWTGDYLAAGVDRITMDVRNLGSTALDLRLWLSGLGGSALSAQAVALPAGGGWTPISFPLDASALSGQALGTLGSVQELRLYHSRLAVFPGAAIVAALGVDNVTAVPEPAAACLMLMGLAAVVARSRARQRA